MGGATRGRDDCKMLSGLHPRLRTYCASSSGSTWPSSASSPGKAKQPGNSRGLLALSVGNGCGLDVVRRTVTPRRYPTL